MRSFCVASWFFILVLASTTLAQDNADPREKLETAVPEAIRLLGTKDYKKFLEMFVAPDDLKRIVKEAGSLEKFAETFGKDKAATRLAILKALKDVKPTLDRDGNRATFTLKEKVDGAPRDTVKFVKVGKLWYILD